MRETKQYRRRRPGSPCSSSLRGIRAVILKAGRRLLGKQPTVLLKSDYMNEVLWMNTSHMPIGENILNNKKLYVV